LERTTARLPGQSIEAFGSSVSIDGSADFTPNSAPLRYWFPIGAAPPKVTLRMGIAT